MKLSTIARGRRRVLVVVTAAAAALSLAACGTSSASSGSKSSGKSDTVKVAVIQSVSGSLGSYGATDVNGIKAAISYINAHGGVAGKQLSADYFDDQSRPETASQLAQKVASNSSYAACLCFSSSLTSTGGLPVLEAQKVPVIVGTSGIGTSPRSAFTVVPSYERVGQLVAQMVTYLGKSKAGSVYSLDQYGKDTYGGFTSSIGAAGITSVGNLALPADATDATSGISRELSAHADVITGFVLNVSMVITNWASLGKPVPLVLGITGATPSAIAPAGSGADKVYVASYFSASHATNDQQRNLIATYKSMFKVDPPLLSSGAWDDVQVLKAAVEKGGTSRSQILDGIAKISGMPAASGTISFANGAHNGWAGGGLFLQYDYASRSYKFLADAKSGS